MQTCGRSRCGCGDGQRSGLEMRNAYRHLFALLSMGFGIALVSYCVISMNRPIAPPMPQAEKTPISFALTSNKPQRKPKPKPRKKTPRSTQKAPPAPMIHGGFSGPSFNLSSLTTTDLTDGLKKDLVKNAQNQVFTADSVDVAPRAVSHVAPRVPMQARRKALTGFVKVRYLITEKGTVDRVRVVESSPKGLFEEGVFTNPVVPPAVPEGGCRLRTSSIVVGQS